MMNKHIVYLYCVALLSEVSKILISNIDVIGLALKDFEWKTPNSFCLILKQIKFSIRLIWLFFL